MGSNITPTIQKVQGLQKKYGILDVSDILPFSVPNMTDCSKDRFYFRKTLEKKGGSLWNGVEFYHTTKCLLIIQKLNEITLQSALFSIPEGCFLGYVLT